MNKERRKRLTEAYEKIGELKEIIGSVKGEEQRAYEKLPENFKCGKREEHYGVRLIYWSALGGESASDTWTPTIDAGELKVLIEDCLNDDTDLEDR